MHGRLIAATQALAVRNGMEDVSLRAASAAVGKSTTVVFQHFGSKEGLLLASMEDALAQDARDHDALLAAMQGLPLSADLLADIVHHYIFTRVRSEAAQLWLEGCYKSREFEMLRPVLQRWDALRERFWQDLLADTPFAARATLLAPLTTAEEAYASTLHDEPGYALMVRESARRLFAVDRDHRPAGVRQSLEARIRPLVPADRDRIGSTMSRLLDQAVRVLVKRGAAGLNLRRVAADAEVAPSQIVYHFGDFAAFRRQAIVEALRQGMPAALDPARPAAEHAGGERRWSETLRDMARPSRAGTPAGFYVSYARILGQACLAAKRDASLRPLMLDLRAIEGAGIHRLSQSEWPEALHLEREAAAGFALWIKGRAVTGEAVARQMSEQDEEATLVAAATLAAADTAESS